jgi:predicted alpha/beta superfamily hydrolase
MIRYAVLFSLVAGLAGCGVPQAESSAVKEGTDDLGADGAAVVSPTSATLPPVRLAHTEQFPLTSDEIGQEFQIKVALPRGYDPDSGPYPVLYATDAETNFGGIAYIVQRLTKDELMPPVIVVGIAYGTDYDTFYDLRSRDLTPTTVPGLRPGGRASPTGGADAFIRFVRQDLFPEIERRYRADPDDRALYGHSYGGLFASYVLLAHPGLFQRYIVLSPSLWFDDELLLRRAAEQVPDVDPAVVYMAAGALEGRIDDEVVAFADRVERQGLTNLRLRAVVLDDETHRTVFGRGFTDGLRYVYGDR